MLLCCHSKTFSKSTNLALDSLLLEKSIKKKRKLKIDQFRFNKVDCYVVNIFDAKSKAVRQVQYSKKYKN